MKILVLGGTQFVGRHIVLEALSRDHELTLFHRGKSFRNLFPEAKEVYGDRNTDLANLPDDRWDVVIDVCSYFPSQSRKAAEFLKDRCQQFINISSMSVYNSDNSAGADEAHPKLQLKPGQDPEANENATYGVRKALCEDEVDKVFEADRRLHLRPSVIVGPFDSTWRFNWWIERFRKGGDILAPNSPETPICFVDVRALAKFTIDCAEKSICGEVNVLGPAKDYNFGRLFESLQDYFKNDSRIHWVEESVLLENKVAPWVELPLWLPQKHYGLHLLSFAKGTSLGLKQIDVTESVDAAAKSFERGEIKVYETYGIREEREKHLIEIGKA